MKLILNGLQSLSVEANKTNVFLSMQYLQNMGSNISEFRVNSFAMYMYLLTVNLFNDSISTLCISRVYST
jgi:hypothetical protein